MNQRDKKRKPETGKSQSSVTNRKKCSSGNNSSNNNNSQPQKPPLTKNQQMKQPLGKTQAPQKPTEQDILQEKDQIKDKPDIKSKPRPKQVIVAGDSIVKGLRGWMMSRDNRVKIHSFNGANADEMQHFLKSLLDREPSHVILHCGTNDLSQGSPCREVAQRIVDLSKIVANKGITCSFSLLTKRTDSLNPLVQQVNNLIEKGIESVTSIDFINNDTISDYHLISSRLHLNRKGCSTSQKYYPIYQKRPNL